MNKSRFKALLQRKGFVHVGYGSTKRTSPYRNSWKYKGRLYRFRTGEMGDNGWVKFPKGEFVVDISVPIEDFDRWANSTYATGIDSNYFFITWWRK